MPEKDSIKKGGVRGMSNAVHLMQNSPESEVGIMPAALLIKDWYR